MKKIPTKALPAVLLAIPLLLIAQRTSISEAALAQLQQAESSITVFVNTKAPGVKKVYDTKRHEYVWKNSNGDFLSPDKIMKPLYEIDKDFYFAGSNNDADHPQVASNYVKKKWDPERGCYVWVDSTTGSFLGRDKPSSEQQQQWLKDKGKNWMTNGTMPGVTLSSKKPATNSDGEEMASEDDTQAATSFTSEDLMSGNVDPDKIFFTSDAQVREAEAGLREARAAISQAKAMGVDVSSYADLSALDKLEAAIKKYKQERNAHR